ncbi:polysaccharide pyruvyl transferase family protein [Formosa sp. S-31]|uniref:polysaccharide pyruvyl transferase family protein n=1 Tax=Formosa sp. S-31 TaxID=2790949 RepID=UPI003EB944FD
MSAADRINYGDLLFPIIFKKAAEKLEIPIVFYNYGLVSSNLSHFGALKTESYKTFLKRVKKEGGKVVIGGGEVFFPDWTKLYSYINPMYVKLLKSYKFRKLNTKYNLAAKLLCSRRVREPFCPAQFELSDKVKIHYNSVGGVIKEDFPSERQIEISRALLSASSISLRDRRSYDSIKKIKENAELVADSAIIMSDFFTKDNLIDLCSSAFNPLNNDYLFIQIGKYYRPKNLNAFVSSLKELSIQLDVKVLLCPIGLALGHEDDIVLRQISTLEETFYYCQPQNIFEIMYCISHSKLYLGTSLHGAITAQSFGVPFIGLNPSIEKLENYNTTWMGEKYKNVPMEELNKIEVRLRNWDFKYVNERVKKQKQSVYNRIFNILN